MHQGSVLDEDPWFNDRRISRRSERKRLSSGEWPT